jgi:hypothetical protein
MNNICLISSELRCPMTRSASAAMMGILVVWFTSSPLWAKLPLAEPSSEPKVLARDLPQNQPRNPEQTLDRCVRLALGLADSEPLRDDHYASIETLPLLQGQADDATLEYLLSGAKSFPKLKVLKLHGRPFTDRSAIALAKHAARLPMLEELTLTYTTISDSGIGTLAAKDSTLTNLQSLVLHATYLSDRSLEALASADTALGNLHSLVVSVAAIADPGVEKLARPDAGLRRLRNLALSRLSITDKGVASLCQAGSPLSSLRSLDISGNRLTKESLRVLSSAKSALRDLDTLDLSSNPLITSEGMDVVRQPESVLRSLHALSFTGTAIDDKGIMELFGPGTPLQSVSTLHLAGTAVTDTGINWLLYSTECGLDQLAELDLMWTVTSHHSLHGMLNGELPRASLRLMRIGPCDVTDALVGAIRQRYPTLDLQVRPTRKPIGLSEAP